VGGLEGGKLVTPYVLLGLAVAGGCSSRTTIEIAVSGERPLFVAARDEDSGWEPIAAQTDGTYQFEASEAFRVLAACANPDGSVLGQELLSTVALGIAQQLPYACDVPADATASVMGTMLQAGTVYFGRPSRSLVGPWTFAFSDLPAGTYDWLAVGNGSGGSDDVKVVLRRDQVVSAMTTVPDVDLMADGISLEPVPLEVLGIQATDQVSTRVDLMSRGNTAELWTSAGSSPSIAEVLTQAVLRFYDLQTITVSVAVPYGIRAGIIGVHSETPPSQVTLLPVPDVVFGAADAQWARRGGETYGVLTIATTCTQDPCAWQVEHVVAMSAWLDATKAPDLVFDQDAPGYMWAIDLATPQSAGFTAVAINGDVEAYSSKLKGP
jgi:hypothetical protein